MKDYLAEFLAEESQNFLKYAGVPHPQNPQKTPVHTPFEGFEGTPPVHISKVLQYSAAPLPLDPDYPCALCRGRVRWNHNGIWRCTACAPPAAFGLSQEP